MNVVRIFSIETNRHGEEYLDEVILNVDHIIHIRGYYRDKKLFGSQIAVQYGSETKTFITKHDPHDLVAAAGGVII